MKKIVAFDEDIWDSSPITGYVVVPTNIGWKSNGENVMGAGLAQQAAERFPELPKIYGKWCKKKGNHIFVNDRLRIICAPTKTLNEEQPHLSWQRPSDPELVLYSYIKLLKLAKEWSVESCSSEGIKYIKCPILGSGKGNIPKEEAVEYAEQFDWTENVKFFDKWR